MNTFLKFFAEYLVDASLTLHPAHPLENLRDDFHMEVRLSALPVTPMALMAMGVVPDGQSARGQGFPQFLFDTLGIGH